MLRAWSEIAGGIHALFAEAVMDAAVGGGAWRSRPLTLQNRHLWLEAVSLGPLVGSWHRRAFGGAYCCFSTFRPYKAWVEGPRVQAVVSRPKQSLWATCPPAHCSQGKARLKVSLLPLPFLDGRACETSSRCLLPDPAPE